MKEVFQIVLICLTLGGCSIDSPINSPSFDFYLERLGTANGTIFFYLEISDSQTYLANFTTESDKLSFVAPRGKLFEVSGKNVFPISTKDFGEHDFKFSLSTVDGQTLVSENFSFVYVYGNLENPALSLSEESSRDLSIKLQVSSARDASINQAWLDGDVDTNYSRKWLDINSLNEVYFKLSPGAGEKYVKAKVRNEIGVESKLVTFETSIDHKVPDGCSVSLASGVVGSNYANIRFHGTDEQGTHFSVTGDVISSFNQVKFKDGDDFWFALSPGEGEKTLNISIGDQAENYCLVQTLEVLVDKTRNPIGVVVTGKPIYTYDSLVDLNLRIDSHQRSDYEIFLSGALQDSQNVRNWQPFQERISVRLGSGSGNRMIYLKVRRDEHESQNVFQHVYFNPQLQIIRGPNTSIRVPKIIETKGITITGCEESYMNVSYVSSYDCTPVAQSVSAVLSFTDGSHLTLSEEF